MHLYHEETREFTKLYFGRMRYALDLTQAKMADILSISCRAYAYIEGGQHCPSASSLLLWMLYIGDEEALRLLHKYKEYLDSL